MAEYIKKIRTAAGDLPIMDEESRQLIQETRDAIPSKLSELENDSGYQTAEQVQKYLSEQEVSWNDLTDKPFHDSEVITKYNRTTVYESTVEKDEPSVIYDTSRQIHALPIYKTICITLNDKEYIGEVCETHDDNLDILKIFEAEGLKWHTPTPGWNAELMGPAIEELEIGVPYSFKIETVEEVTEFIEKKFLDEEFIPDTIARVSDITRVDKKIEGIAYENLPDKPFDVVRYNSDEREFLGEYYLGDGGTGIGHPWSSEWEEFHSIFTTQLEGTLFYITAFGGEYSGPLVIEENEYEGTCYIIRDIEKNFTFSHYAGHCVYMTLNGTPLFNSDFNGTDCKIEKAVEVRLIDDKHISENIARKSDLENISSVVSWNDLTDKPFSEVGEKRTEVFSGTIITNDNGYFENEKYDESDMPYYQFEFHYPAYMATRGCVTLNGVEYELYPHDELAGRPLVAPDDSEVSIYIQSDWQRCTIDGLEPNTSYEIKFEYIAPGQINCLDDKYISDNIARVSDVEALVEEAVAEHQTSVDTQIQKAVAEHAVSWNDLTDKPFGEEVVETRNTLHESVVSTYFDDGDSFNWIINSGFFKDVSTSPEKYTALLEKNICITVNGIEFTDGKMKIEPISGQEVQYGVYFNGIYHWGYHPWYGGENVSADLANIISTNNVPFKVEIVVERTNSIKTLDEKYIPDTIARKSDLENISSVVSWNDLTDKPFYVGESEVTIEKELYLDTDLHGPVYESWEDDEGEVYEELIEDNNFDELKFIEECVGKVSYVTFDDKEYICDTTNEITSSSTNRETGFYRMLSRDGSFMIVVEYNFNNESYIFMREVDVYVNGEKLDKNDTDLEHHITIENEYEKIVTPIKTLDPKFIPWSEGTPSWNNLTDKPFSAEILDETRVEVVSTTITTDGEGNFCNEYYNEDEMPEYHFDAHYPVEVTTKGYVTLNGIEYELHPSTTSAYRPLITPDESEVRITIFSGWNSFTIVGLEPDTSYELRFDYAFVEEDIKTLDDKFIPDNIARRSDIDELRDEVYNKETSWNDLTDKPFYEGEPERHLIHENTISKDSNGDFVGKSPFNITEGRVLVKLNGGNFYGEMTLWDYEYVYNDEGEELEVSIYRFIDEYDELYIKFEQNSKKLRSFRGMAVEDYGDDHVFEFKLYSLDEPPMILNDECISDNIARISDVEDVISNHVVDWNTLSNKPFGEEPVVAEVLYENEVETNIYGNIDLVMLFSDNFSELFVLDSIYQFTLDTKKAIVKFTNENNGMGEGEFETIDGSFTIDGTDATQLLIHGIKDGTHYLKIERIDGAITHTLDDKFISENIARKDWVEEQLRNGSSNVEVSWNDLADKPFYTVEVPVVRNGDYAEFTFDLPGVTMEQECIVTYSGDNKYHGWEHTLLDLMTSDYRVHKYDTHPTVEVEVTDAGIHCLGRMENDSTGTVTVVVTLDDKYISENIARTSQLPSKTSDLENDSNYISKAELQNILDQIKLNVTEDGTISISIPTIS